MKKLIRNRWYIGAPMLLAAAMAMAQDGSAVIKARWDDGVLRVVGTAGPDQISIASSGGLIEVNGGLVRISGGLAMLSNTRRIIVHAGAGNDQVTLHEFNGALPAADLDGGEGHDLLIGASGDDLLKGRDGNDVLIGHQGNDFVQGQGGDDLLIVNEGDGNDLIEGGLGRDVVQVSSSNSDDEISIMERSDGAVMIHRNSGSIVADTEIRGVEDLQVYGQGGDDVIKSSLSGASSMALALNGDQGNDLLSGGDGVEVLRGGAGNDTLLGNRGNDVVLGQDGDDLMIVNSGDGSDVYEGGNGRDVVQANGSESDDEMGAVLMADGAVIFITDSIEAGDSSVIIGTTELMLVDGLGGNDVIIGSDAIALNARGGSGEDLLIGGAGNDFLDGGEGRDQCRGGGGNDRFSGCESVD